MFPNEINYNVIDIFSKISIEDLFKLFLDTNNFIDMSDIIIMELKTYKIIDAFLSRYMKRYKDVELNILKELVTEKGLMKVSKYDTKEHILAILELYYRGLLIIWYKKNKDKYIMKLKYLGDKCDIFISYAFISQLYF